MSFLNTTASIHLLFDEHVCNLLTKIHFDTFIGHKVCHPEMISLKYIDTLYYITLYYKYIDILFSKYILHSILYLSYCYNLLFIIVPYKLF